MTFFADLTEYTYLRDAMRPGTKNIGWLKEAADFKLANHPSSLVERVWNTCGISVAQTRGFFVCPLCKKFSVSFAVRGSQSLFLGTSEIRVFSRRGDIYAAPTLIYHYMETHNYCPPDEFLTALIEGMIPPSGEYFSRLRELGIAWMATSTPPVDRNRYRWVRMPDQTVVKVVVDDEENGGKH
jgi:hypothetical protein